MATRKRTTPRQIARMFAGGILLSMITFYLLHFFGTWELQNYRPDAETTSSLLLYNKCAVLGDVHTLTPNNLSSPGDNINETKFAASFMNFVDGHIVAMIALCFVVGVLIFLIRKGTNR